MRFAEPYWLLAGLAAVTLAGVLLVRAERLRSRALAILEGARLRSRSAATAPLRRWLRIGVTTLAVALGFVALARPQKGMHWETVERNGIDLLLVVDTSRSMDADDVRPTRLQRAKLAIRDLVDRFPGDRIGLVAFAGDAFVQTPMTLDHGALLESVDSLDTSVIARGGTNIGRGIDIASEALASQPGRHKVMVILSDGEDLEGQGLAEATRAAADGITIDTVGVGTPSGDLVPARDSRGAIIGVIRDESGAPVRSRLDKGGLKAIAGAASGAYRPLGLDGRGLDRLYDEALAGLTHTETSSRTRRVYSEWFEVPLGLSLFGIVLDALLGRRWRRLGKKLGKKSKMSKSAAPAMAAAAGFLLLMSPGRAQASVAGAAKAYAAGRFDDASRDFEAESARNPKDARLAFNAGDAAYRAGHYDAADAAFKRALASAEPRLQQRVLYNEGDVQYRLGDSRKADAVTETIAQWKAAIESYDGALALDPKDADARFNRDLVKRKLAALEEKQKNDPKEDKKDSSGSPDKPSPQGGGSTKDSKGDKDDKPSGAEGGGKSASSGSKPSPESKGTPQQPSSGPQNSAHGQNGEPSTPPDSGSAKQGHNPTPGTPPGEEQGGQGSRPEGVEEGRLSPRDARALLKALRGEERRGVSYGADAGESPNDVPRKDW